MPDFPSVGQKGTASLWGLCTRHLRRLQNQQRLISSSHQQRHHVREYSPEEFVGLCAYFFQKGWRYDSGIAEQLGLRPVLEWVRQRVHIVQPDDTPKNAAQKRHEDMIELLVFGTAAPAVARLGLSAVEAEEWQNATRACVAKVMQTPSARRRLAAGLGEALVRVAATGSPSSDNGRNAQHASTANDG